MGLGQGPPAYLAPFAPWCTQNKSALRVSPVFVRQPRGTNTHKALDSLPVLHFAVHLLPCSVNNTSFKLQDLCLLNELTLCIFDSGYWRSISLRVTWHKEAFCSQFSASSPCVLLVILCSLVPHLFPKERSTLKGRLFNSPSFYSLCYTIFILPQYLPLAPAPSFYSSPASCPAADLAFVG